MSKILIFLTSGVSGIAIGVLGTLIVFSLEIVGGPGTKSLEWGQFPVKAKFEFVDDEERKIKLLNDFAYIDPNGLVWKATKGHEVDGASIPQFFWSITDGPYSGKFRNASIVHDEACDRETEPWQEVHKMFYNACRCEGLPEAKAKLFFLAVYHRGPRWGDDQNSRLSDYLVSEYLKNNKNKNHLQEDKDKVEGVPGINGGIYPLMPPMLIRFDKKKVPYENLTQEDLDSLEKYINDENPSLDQIMKLDLKETIKIKP